MSSGRSSGPNWTRIRQNCPLLFAILAWAALLVDALILRSLVVHPLRDLALGILAAAGLYWHMQISRRAGTSVSFNNQVAAFRGLLPFEPSDADRFYGRELEVTAIADLIGHSQYQFGVLYGDSGCGKTSVIQAGVLPRLEARSFWAVVCRSYGDPLSSIIAACRRRSNITPDKNESTISYLGRVAEKSRSGLIIICDQFEEFYVSSPNKRDRTPFLEFLSACSQASFSMPVKFLLVMRSDFLHFVIASFDEYLPDVLVTSKRYHLQQFDEQQAMEVIAKSVAKAQWPVEAGLSRQIAQDLAVNDTVLPSELQIVGEQLQNKRLFTLEQYTRAGGKEQLVHGYLEDVINLTGDVATAQLILRCLISEEDTRLTLPLAEIQRRVQRSERTVERIVKFFAQMRLVREIRQDDPWRYELIHEYLIGKINQTTGRIMDATQRANRYLRQYLSNYGIDKRTRIPITRLGFIRRHSDLQQNEQCRRLLKKSLWHGLFQAGAIAIVLAVLVVATAAWLSVTQTWDEVLLNDGHTAGAHRVVFSPDGRLLVSCGEDGKVIVWDFARRLKLATLKGHTAWVHALAFSPDGKWFATGGYDHKVIVWDAATFAQEKVLADNSGYIGALGVSPDSSLLAATASSGGTTVWNTVTWQKHVFLPAQRDYGASWFSADNHQLFISGTGWWDLATRRLVTSVGGGDVWDAISPNKKVLVSIGSGGTVSFTDVISQKVSSIKVHQDNGRAIAFSPDGRLLATGADNIVLWDAASRRKIVRLTYPSIVWALAFSPDGRYLVSAHGDGSILIWDPHEHELLANLNGHSAPVRTVAYSPDGKRIASGGEDDSVIIWNAQTGAKEAVLLNHKDKVTGLAFSPDAQYLASVDFSSVVMYEQVAPGGSSPRWTAKRYGGTIYCLAVSADGRWVATPSGVYDARDGKLIALMNVDSWGIAFSPDSSSLIYPSRGDLFFWRPGTGETARRKINSNIVTVSFSPDGKLLATGEDEGAVRLWQVDPFREVAILGRHGARVKSVIFSPDGKEVASAGDDHVINLWSVARRRRIATIGIHASPVLSLAFSPDGKHLVSGEHDNSVRLYTSHHSLWGRLLD